MKSIISFVIIVSFLYVSAIGQDNAQLDRAKFKLIKNVVWFYSVDTKAGWSNPRDCKDSKDYAALIECSKGMKGVDANVKKWNDFNVVNFQQLEMLSQQIIVAAIKGREYRINDFKEEFNLFKYKSKEIINEVSTNLSEKNVENENLTYNEVLNQPLTEEKILTQKETSVDEDKARAKELSGNRFNIPLLLTLLIAIAALTYSVIIGMSLKKEIRKLKEIANLNENITTNLNLTQRFNSLEKEIKSFDGSIDTLREEFSKKIKNIMTPQTSPEQHLVNPVQNTQPETINKPSIITKYAKYADLGDGFSLNQLSDEQDEKIFEILISPNNTAKFKIVSNRNGQLLALSDTNLYFNKICKYDSVPTSNSTITTETEGELKLQGNKWQIVSPAKINFF